MTSRKTAPSGGAVSGSCQSTGCRNAAVARCAQCGRAFCASHGDANNNGRVRCTSCLEQVFGRIAALALRSNRLDDAAAALAPWTDGSPAMTAARQQLGLVRAQQGNARAAMEQFQPLLPSLENAPGFRPVLAQVYLRRAAQFIVAEDLLTAAGDLAAATRLDPQLQTAHRVLPRLRNWLVLSLIRSGELERAAQEWEAEWATCPTSLRLNHWLAILNYRIGYTREKQRAAALQNGGASIPTVADPYWRRAIGCWGAVLYSPAFWDTWRQERAQSAGLNFSDEDITAIKDTIKDRIQLDLRDGASNAEQAGRKQEADQYHELEVLWGLEIITAKLVGDCTLEYNVKDWSRGLACGPLMLEQLNGTTAGKPVATALRRAAPSFPGVMGKELAQYISPLGRYHFLINEKRFDQAIADLEKVSAWPQSKELLGIALAAKAAELTQPDQWDEALSAFERAKGYKADLSAYEKTIVNGSLNRVRELMKDEAQYDTAIDRLERALKLVNDGQEIRSNLSVAYAQKARVYNNNGDYEQAAKLIRIAVKHDPNEPQTRHWARVTMGNLAGKIFEREPDKAVQLLNEGFTYEDTREVRQEFSNMLFNWSTTFARKKDRSRAVQLMLEEIRYDPEAKVPANQQEAAKRVHLFFIFEAHEALEKNDFNSALDNIAQARQYYEDAETFLLHAAVLRNAGRPDQALQVLKDGYMRNSSNTDLRHAYCVALHNRGVEMANADRYDQSIDLLKQALNVENSEDTRKMLSQAYQLRANNKAKYQDRYGTIADLQEALKYDPNNWELSNLIRRIS